MVILSTYKRRIMPCREGRIIPRQHHIFKGLCLMNRPTRGYGVGKDTVGRCYLSHAHGQNPRQ